MTKNLNFFRIVKFADIVTLANAFSGMIAMFFAFNHLFDTAAIFLLISVIFDFLDGKFARMSKKANILGRELDSLSDVIAFGVAPVVFVFFLVQNQAWYYYACYVVFLSAGIFRLARFNAIPTDRFYYGMPITMNGIVLPFLFFANFPTHLFPLIMLLSAVLMVSTVKVEKVI